LEIVTLSIVILLISYISEDKRGNIVREERGERMILLVATSLFVMVNLLSSSTVNYDPSSSFSTYPA
jgi:hypothetical protein